MGMRYYKKSLVNLLFEKVEKPDSEAQRFRQVLNDGIDSIDTLAAAIAKSEGFDGIQASIGMSQPGRAKSEDNAETLLADALRNRLSGATVKRVNSISDIHITPGLKKEPVVKVEVKFSHGEITKVPIGSTPLSSHDYIVLADATGYRWAPARDLIKFAQSRESAKGKAALSAEEFMSNSTEELYGGYPVRDITAGEYEYIAKLIRSRIAKARGDTDKADVSYTMPFTIDGSKVRVDLKFESLFREYISELLKE